MMKQFLALMVTHPEVQMRAQKEIESVVGLDRLPNLNEYVVTIEISCFFANAEESTTARTRFTTSTQWYRKFSGSKPFRQGEWPIECRRTASIEASDSGYLDVSRGYLTYVAWKGFSFQKTQQWSQIFGSFSTQLDPFSHSKARLLFDLVLFSL